MPLEPSTSSGSYAVVIPAHDAAGSITTSIRSALADERVVEVVVVDDGSDDDTAAVAASTADERVAVIRQIRGGPAVARNRGAAAATADRLVFLDADDELTADAIELFEQAPAGARLVRTGTVIIDPTGARDVMLAVEHEHPYPRGAPFAGSFAIERTLFGDIGGYDPRYGYGENSELLLRAHQALARTGDAGAFVAAPSVVYVQRSGRPAAYAERRLRSTDLMLSEHADALSRDRDTHADHLAIAAFLRRQNGDRLAAIRAALALIRLDPRSARAWGSLAKSAAARRSNAS